MRIGEVVFKIIVRESTQIARPLLSGMFVVAILLTFATVYTNPQMLDAIRSEQAVLYAPTLVIGVFGLFFMVYANNSYARYRMRELGLLYR